MEGVPLAAPESHNLDSSEPCNPLSNGSAEQRIPFERVHAELGPGPAPDPQHNPRPCRRRRPRWDTARLPPHTLLDEEKPGGTSPRIPPETGLTPRRRRADCPQVSKANVRPNVALIHLFRRTYDRELS